MMKPLLVWFFRLFGLLMVANGLWMVASAVHWFYTLPAGLPDTGHPNGHLIRDVGLAYLIFGAASTWCSFQLRERRPVFLCAAAFMIGHALDHVAEILLGVLPFSHWLLDLPGVLVPGVFFAVFTHPGAWNWLVSEGQESSR
jgi:hypothetical protein